MNLTSTFAPVNPITTADALAMVERLEAGESLSAAEHAAYRKFWGFHADPEPVEDDRAWAAANLNDGPGHSAGRAPAAPGLGLADYVRGEASWYRQLGGSAAELVAETLEALAGEIDLNTTAGQPITVDQFRDRRDTRERWEWERLAEAC